MTTVDRRVVGLGFENKEFESGVKTSIKTLGDLTKSLELKEPGKGFNALTTAAKSVDLGKIADTVGNIGSKFSAMGILGVTTFANLANSAIEFGKSLVKSVTIDPIQQGFAEYEAGLDAFQTILANTASSGKGIDDVNEAMKQLGEYANLTKYSYGDMTKAIGLFTAQGVSLEDSLIGIKGIYNIVSLTGGTAEKASGAIYQISQALSAGVVKAQDWNSVISAGIGGKDFQDQLTDTARLHGVNVEKMIKQTGSFKASLESGWLTGDIFLETLSKYSGDMTKEQIKAMGGAVQAQQQYVLFTKEQIKSIGVTGDQLKALKLNEVTVAAIGANYSQEQLKAAGLTVEQLKLVDSYMKTGTASLATMTTASNNLSDAQVDAIYDLGQRAKVSATQIKSFSQLMDVLRSNTVTSWATSFKLIFGELDSAVGLWTDVGNSIGSILDSGAKERNSMLEDFNLMGGREVLISALRLAFQGLMNIIKPIGEVLRAIFPPITALQIYNISTGLVQLAYAFKSATDDGEPLKRVIMGIVAIFQIIGDAIFTVVDSILRLAGVLTGGLVGSLNLSYSGLMNFIAGIGDSIVAFRDMLRTTDYFNNAIRNIGPFLQKVNDKLYNLGQTIMPYLMEINDFLYGLRLRLEGFFSGLTSVTAGKDLMQGFADGISYGAGEVWKALLGLGNTVIQKFKDLFQINSPSKLFAEFGGNLIEGLIQGLKETGGMIWTFFEGIGRDITKFFTIAADGTSPAMKAFSSLAEFAGKVSTRVRDSFGKAAPDIKKSLSGLGKAIMDALSGVSLETVFAGLNVGFLAALIMSLRKFLSQGSALMEGVTGVLGGVEGSLQSWQKSLDSKSLMNIAKAVGILAVSILVLSFIPADRLALAVGAITVMFAELSGSLALFSKVHKTTPVPVIGAEIMLLAGGILLLSLALGVLAQIPMDKLIIGVGAVGVLMAEIAAFTALMGKASKTGGIPVRTAVSIALLAAGIWTLTFALERLSKIDQAVLEKGLLAMGIILAEIGAFAALVGKSNLLGAAIGMVIMSVALNMISDVLVKIGGMDQQKLGVGLLVMAGALAAITVSIALMSNALSGAAAIVIVALALNMLLPVLLVFSQLSMGQLQSIAAGLGILVIAFIAIGGVTFLLASVAPAIMILALSILVVSGAFMLGSLAMAIFVGALATLLGMFTILKIVAPQLLTVIVSSIVQFTMMMAAATPVMVAAIKVIVDGMVEVIAYAGPSLIAAFIGIIAGILYAIDAKIYEFTILGMQIIIKFLIGIRNSMEEITKVGMEIIINFIKGIESKVPELMDAIASLLKTILDYLVNGLKNLIGPVLVAASGAARTLMGAFIAGIEQRADAVWQTLVNMAQAAWGAVLDFFNKITGNKGGSPKAGGAIPDGMATGINDGAGVVVDAVQNLSDKAKVSLSEAMRNALGSVGGDMHLNPTIRPVVDLSNVVASGGLIDRSLGNRTIDISGVRSRLPQVAGAFESASNSKPQNGSNTIGSSVTFNQYNSSPKALSAIEIYRQTRNQLGALKGVV